MNQQAPSRLNDFLISGAISLFLSFIIIILISESSSPPMYPDDTHYFYIGPWFIGFWFLFTVIGAVILFIISLVIRAVLGPKNYSTPNTYNPPNYQTQYQQPAPPSTNKEDAYKSLEQLSKLKEKGIVTEEEFQEQKNKLLNS